MHRRHMELPALTAVSASLGSGLSQVYHNPRAHNLRGVALMRLKRFDGPGDWIGQARGKALKLVAQLLPGVDARVRYRIVFMERPLNEVIASQRTMYPKPGIRHDNRHFPQSRYNNI